MRRLLPLAPLVLLLVGCPRKPIEGFVSPEVQRWAPPPSLVEYTRVNLAGEMPLPDSHIREEWRGPVLEGNQLLYDVYTWDISGDTPVLLEIVRHTYGPDGYGYLGTMDEEGDALEAWEPVEIVLPARPRVGDTWSETHTKGNDTSVRSCEIMASNYCDGLVVVCESERSGGRIILRDHYCSRVGWSGFEALVITPMRPTVRMWSESVSRDGVRLPDPEPTGD